MNQTKIGNRVVLIAGTAPASEKIPFRQPTATERATSHRIVLIRDGKFVGNRPVR